MFTRIAVVTLLALAAGWAQTPTGRGPGRGARILGGEAGMPGRVVKNAPYSADLVTESTQTLADGSHVHQTNTARVYRDSEGRTRREQSLGSLRSLSANAPHTQMVFINDPVAGVNYALNPVAKTANQSAWTRHPGPNGQQGANGSRPQAQFAHQHQRGNDANVKTESLGTQTIEGVQAQGTRTTFTIPANTMGNDAAIQIVNERWYSPDLQMVVLTKHSDPRSGETVTRLSNINRAEPSAALFQVPSDFKVSQVSRPMHAQPPAAQQ
jgi:hypothetical protein